MLVAALEKFTVRVSDVIVYLSRLDRLVAAPAH